MAVTLPAGLLREYSRFTLYNSPYAAHDHGCAVDLYPGDATHPDPEDGPPVPAPSPVAGTVLDVRTVTAPSRPYAAEDDHLIVVDTGTAPDSEPDSAPAAPETDDSFGAPEGDSGPDPPETDRRRASAVPGRDRGESGAPVARILHVDPAVEPGEAVAVGDHLGTLVRAGFFAPWVANHIHLGFRPPDADPYRAAGSLPLELDPALALEPVAWDGTGTVVAAGESYAVLDEPAHPAPGEAFAGLAATDAAGAVAGVLDGGLPHYDGGGLLRNGAGGDATGDAPEDRSRGPTDPVRLLDTPVGTVEGRDVAWADPRVLADSEPVRGIALAPARDELGVKLVGEGLDLAVGTDVRVTVGTNR